MGAVRTVVLSEPARLGPRSGVVALTPEATDDDATGGETPTREPRPRTAAS